MPESKKIKLKKKRRKVRGSKRPQLAQKEKKKKERPEEEKNEKPKESSKEKKKETEEKKEEVKLHYTALNKILRHGFRFSHPDSDRKDWVECMGFLAGDVEDNTVEIKDAIPMVHGNLVEVEFKDEHYSKADEINQNLTDKNWIVGWYHTHPGHGLFLSPVDKVNHSGYQTLNSHAVALVFDPSEFGEKNKFKEYIKIFRLEDPDMREKSEFTEITEIKIHLPLSQVLTSIYETSNVAGTDYPTILEYGEKIEDEVKPAPSIYLDAEDVEKDLRDMRNLIKHLHKEVKVLHGNLQRHMASTNKAVEDIKKDAKKKEGDPSLKCEFCGNTSVSAEDTVCGNCGKGL
jgi:proteasome lid subunit RPN8/RPN11